MIHGVQTDVKQTIASLKSTQGEVTTVLQQYADYMDHGFGSVHVLNTVITQHIRFQQEELNTLNSLSNDNDMTYDRGKTCTKICSDTPRRLHICPTLEDRVAYRLVSANPVVLPNHTNRHRHLSNSNSWLDYIFARRMRVSAIAPGFPAVLGAPW